MMKKKNYPMENSPGPRFALSRMTRRRSVLGGGLALGALVLLAYAVLARCYWFRVPLLGVGLALALYILGIIVKTA